MSKLGLEKRVRRAGVGVSQPPKKVRFRQRGGGAKEQSPADFWGNGVPGIGNSQCHIRAC